MPHGSFEPLYTAEEMRAAEAGYPGYPVSAPELMDRAGSAVAREAMRAFPRARRFAVVCGGGANGGDGAVAARVLREAGREAVETDEPEGYDVVVDALFGTGFRGAPRPEAAAVIERINGAGTPVVSVDLPSGVNASTGEIEGAAVRAALTVTFHGRKVGLVVAPGRFHAGRVVVADIGLEHLETNASRTTDALLRHVPRRAPHDSKYTAGVVLVVGGSPGMTGAAVLCATAALRADAGYVTLAVPVASLPVVETLALEPVKRGFTWEHAVDEILADAARANAVALGPGLGRGDEAHALVRALLERLELPVVVDADALFGLEPVERAAADRSHAARRRARPPARRHRGGGGRAPARDRPRLRRALRCRRAAEGGRHDRAGPHGRPHRLRPGAAVARHRRQRRRAHRRDRRLPGQGPRAGDRGCRSRDRARHRRGHAAEPGRARRRATSSRRCPAALS